MKQRQLKKLANQARTSLRAVKALRVVEIKGFSPFELKHYGVVGLVVEATILNGEYDTTTHWGGNHATLIVPPERMEEIFAHFIVTKVS